MFVASLIVCACAAGSVRANESKVTPSREFTRVQVPQGQEIVVDTSTYLFIERRFHDIELEMQAVRNYFQRAMSSKKLAGAALGSPGGLSGGDYDIWMTKCREVLDNLETNFEYIRRMLGKVNDLNLRKKYQDTVVSLRGEWESLGKDIGVSLAIFEMEQLVKLVKLKITSRGLGFSPREQRGVKAEFMMLKNKALKSASKMSVKEYSPYKIRIEELESELDSLLYVK